ncbi:MAG TPA: hypothetical protein GXZ20_03610 [Halanaerobiaceae bacterium]|jgi:uncharacterized membrane protein YeaQ/YmgE (transglycosylase-associated protein family)|nr:hypothetical protein [Bacillota bacterium]HHU92213.1 hypothetical protein [Halanaerobiaceae bacterium]HOA41689.1 hypothetical protein [Halanaerobiales bacterium]HPZ63712.1 hypothetical protein [Halanaerobiales bacterium]HQD04980.1 hypothetical protein [Halanaerobiales bacterium]
MWLYVLVLVVLSAVMAGVLQYVFKEMEVPGGYWNRLVGSVIGALVGDLVLNDWGWMLAGYNVIAGIIGSFLLGWLYIYLVNRYIVERSEKTQESA